MGQSTWGGALRCRQQFAAQYQGSSVPRSLSSSASLCPPTSAPRCPGRSAAMASELLGAAPMLPPPHVPKLTSEENLATLFSACLIQKYCKQKYLLHLALKYLKFLSK